LNENAVEVLKRFQIAEPKNRTYAMVAGREAGRRVSAPSGLEDHVVLIGENSTSLILYAER
jgi:hypothetical protein